MSIANYDYQSKSNKQKEVGPMKYFLICSPEFNLGEDVVLVKNRVNFIYGENGDIARKMGTLLTLYALVDFLTK